MSCWGSIYNMIALLSYCGALGVVMEIYTKLKKRQRSYVSYKINKYKTIVGTWKLGMRFSFYLFF